MGARQIKPTEEQRVILSDNFEKLCARAAAEILRADCFLLATGAGMSADSGLKVYADVANVKAYRDRDLTYSDICVPSWLETEPDLFFGFWGSCFNDYRNTQPHEGYSIIRRWRDKLFANNQEWDSLMALESNVVINEVNDMAALPLEKRHTIIEPEDLKHFPGRFFIFTSNVDAHSQKAGFSKTEVYELHGNTETWQCSKPCCNTVWSAPPNYRFDVNPETMLCKSPDPEISLEAKKKDRGFATTHPVCIQEKCEALARPSIIMFGDTSHTSDVIPYMIYDNWQKTLLQYVKKPHRKLVVFEIGCGNRVPSVRRETENYLRKLGDQATLIRINPDFPLADDNFTRVIPIQSFGLKAIKKIDEYVQNFLENIATNEGKVPADDPELDSILKTLVPRKDK